MKNFNQDRVLFLKEFTKELIINSKVKGEKVEEIFFKYPNEAEKKNEEEIEENKEETTKLNKQISANKKEMPLFPVIKPLLSRRMLFKPLRKPIFMQGKEEFKPSIMSSEPVSFQEIREEQKSVLKEQGGKEIDFGKISLLIQDSKVSVIECPGTGELVVVKINGKPIVTKIFLNKEDIQKIIEQFSRKASIPIVAGAFKAYAGNLLLTAVVSEVVGSRFTITKITAAFVIQQANKKF